MANDILMYMNPTSIYIHIPFCQKRCSYCDFNTYSGLDRIIKDYIRALVEEIVEVTARSAEKILIHSIYFGGGTPSYIEIDDLQMVMETLRERFQWSEEMEISLEANPGTLNQRKLEKYVEMGIRRLSLGVQTAMEKELKLLERIHGNEDVKWGVKWAREAGIEQINLDFIYGLPGQRLEDWSESLRFGLSFEPEHLSLYSLTIEEGTKLAEWVKEGKYPLPDADLAADCYEAARECLEKEGYIHYEISNWAKRAGYGRTFKCRHNEQYWKNLPYIGFGAGAHGYIDGFRIANHLHPVRYIRELNHKRDLPFPFSSALSDYSIVDRETEMKETMMLGLRLLVDGVGDDDFFRRFGVHIEEVFHFEIKKLLDQGLVEWIAADQKRLRLTRYGELLGNRVFREFI